MKTVYVMALIKTRQRNCLQLESDLIIAVSTVPTRIEKVMSA